MSRPSAIYNASSSTPPVERYPSDAPPSVARCCPLLPLFSLSPPSPPPPPVVPSAPRRGGRARGLWRGGGVWLVERGAGRLVDGVEAAEARLKHRTCAAVTLKRTPPSPAAALSMTPASSGGGGEGKSIPPNVFGAGMRRRAGDAAWARPGAAEYRLIATSSAAAATAAGLPAAGAACAPPWRAACDGGGARGAADSSPEAAKRAANASAGQQQPAAASPPVLIAANSSASRAASFFSRHAFLCALQSSAGCSRQQYTTVRQPEQ